MSASPTGNNTRTAKGVSLRKWKRICRDNITSSSSMFTWANKQEDIIFVQDRLDRFVGSLEWSSLFSNAQVTNLGFSHLDHRAVKVTLGSSWVWVRRNSSKGGKRRFHRFHFEELWTRDEECREVISSAWGASGSLTWNPDIVDMLGMCAEKLDEWGFRKYGRIKREIDVLQQEIERKKSDSSFSSCVAEIEKLESELEGLLCQDEIYWKQRSRMEWMAHGDRNSRVFHLKASERKCDAPGFTRIF
ncbi:hypothetical protein UlMin_025983 [Ulmus minor]